MTVRIGINGFGRIGRVVMRAAMNRKDIEIVHINDLTDTKSLGHLLKYDSVHGRFAHPVKVESDALVIGDRRVTVPGEDRKLTVSFTDYGTKKLLERCAHHTRITMLGVKDSLNVAVAFGIAAYHAARALGGSRS